MQTIGTITKSVTLAEEEYTFTVTAPIVNLNGASKESLIEQQLGVLTVIADLIDAMGAASPHGRDFQFVDANGSLFRAAADEHRAELITLHLMKARHRAILESLSEA